MGGDRTSPYIVAFRDDAVTRSVEKKEFYVVSTATASDGARELDGERVRAKSADLERRLRIHLTNVYENALGGFSADLTAAQVRALEADPAVEYVIADAKLDLDDGAAVAPDEAGLGIRTTSNPSASVPAGVRRVGAPRNVLAAVDGRDTRVDADVAVLDTGIERSHPDLNVAGGYNCTSRNRERWGDGDGHGTHVAGTIGALDNNIGVVGVAPGARLWSVKVLNSRGTGYTSWLVCGINWVTSQRDPQDDSRARFEAANMSISYRDGRKSDCGKNERDPVHQAICRSVERGTVYVVAAGNESRNARFNHPASYEEVITVSAMADYDGRAGGSGRPSDSCPYWTPETDDSFAKFSNFGSDVDLIAPGRCVLSTYTRKRYAWMSGTSMATPHVSGAVAVYRAMYGSATPQQVKLALQAVATRDWNTRSDPDSNHEKAVWIGEFRTMPDFAVAPANAQVGAGQFVDVALGITRVGGFTDPVSMELVDAPPGFTATSGSSMDATATVRFEVASGVVPGWYYLTLRSASGDVTHTTVIALNVPGWTHGPTLGTGGAEMIDLSGYSNGDGL